MFQQRGNVRQVGSSVTALAGVFRQPTSVIMTWTVQMGRMKNFVVRVLKSSMNTRADKKLMRLCSELLNLFKHEYEGC